MPTPQNGRIPASALTLIPGGGRLLHVVAIAWMQICAEVYRLHGWTPTPTGPLDSYRPYDGNYYAQVETFLRRYTRTRQPGRPTKVWNGVTYWLLPGQSPAAVPGTSNHGWACAVDVTGLGGFTGTRYRQFAAVAARHGWTNTEGRQIGEPWHWVDVGTANLVAKGLLDLGTLPDGAHLITDLPDITPLTPLDMEDDMKVIAGPTGRALVGAHYYRILANDRELANAVAVWGPAVTLDADQMASVAELALSGTAGRDLARSVWATTVQRGATLVPALQEVADAKSLALGQKPASVVVDIDEAALAAQIAALIGTLSDADVQRVAKASADEQARRLAS